ncbi:hypothetical protein [Subtercola sp. YIM 133946]|uniref:hypothetical protein n=1 Tax=Subtercola sp. YIM 133946 TaxID=3118909 RepID=UPI002F91E04B
MPFQRVRQVGGPAHQFDISIGELEAHPDLYEVLDDVVVDSPRDVVYIEPTVPQKQPRKKPATGPKTSVGKTETTSEGEGQ